MQKKKKERKKKDRQGNYLTQEVEKLKFQIDELTPVILFQWTC
jgi:hypothetical protein